ncbi:MAG: 6-carboxytetrahydropterin synthase [Verrucomicrobia bacterium]|nr:6-carboxytetrahydropterin synthase [Kiritimatiellia bacterium]MCP5489247.1 6-carboxytetrahydropterin synthase [Verrucomicrobiota bacterium]
MPYRICKQLVVENGHMLSKHPDNCKFPHGHTRRIEFVLEADALDAHDMVCDFKVISVAMHAFVQRFDHAMCVNTNDPNYEALKQAYGDRVIGFEGEDPTTEVMAKTIFDDCRAKLALYPDNPHPSYILSEKVRLVRVRVWETESSWAEYAE